MGETQDTPQQPNDQGLPEPVTAEKAAAYLHRRVVKYFAGVPFEGTVQSVDTSELPFWYRVLYEDGDEEDLAFKTTHDGVLGLEHLLQPAEQPVVAAPVKGEPMHAGAGQRRKPQSQLFGDEKQAHMDLNGMQNMSYEAAGSLNEGTTQHTQPPPSKRRRPPAPRQQVHVLQPRQPNHASMSQGPAQPGSTRAGMAAGSSDTRTLRTTGLAGHLRKIRLENFMCHELFEMEFGPHVTLISGQNGSGKSAIMQGLQTCLGVSARATGRATALTKFIREGANDARVQITLHNTGVDAFEPLKFGDCITIERRLTRSGGTSWKALNAAGKVVSEHKPADVLKHLGVNAANPLTIITQDMARAFLSGTSDDKKRKYHMFMEGTMLDDIRDELATASTNVHESVAKAKKIKLEHAAKVKEAQEVQEKLKALELVDRQIEVKDQMDRAFIYSYVWKREAEVMELRDLVHNQAPAKRLELQQRLDQIKTLLQQTTEEEQALNAAIQEIQEAAKNAAADLRHLRDNHAAAAAQIRALKREKDRVQMTQRDLEGRKEELERVLNEDQGEKAQQRREAIEQLERDAAEKMQAVQQAEEALTANRLHCSAVQGQIEEARNVSARLQSDAQSHARQVQDKMRDMQNLEDARQDKVAAFGGPKVVQLLQAIHRNQHRFSAPPIGPVGAYLGLTESRWAIAIQAAIGPAFNSFLCNTQADAKVVRDLARQVGINLQSFTTVATTFGLPPHNVPRRNLGPGLATVMSILTVSEPSVQTVIMNWLIDSWGIEKVALADNDQLAGDAVYGDTEVRTCYVPDGTVLKKSGHTVTRTRYFSRGPPQLGLDNGQMMQQLQESIANSQEARRLADEHARGKAQELKVLETEFRDLQRQQTELGKQLKAAKQALQKRQRDLQDQQAAPEQGDQMDELATQVATFQNEILQAQGQMADMDGRLQALIEEEKVARELFEQRKSTSERQPDEMATYAAKLDGVQKRKAEHMRGAQDYEQRLANVEQRLLALQQKLQAGEEELAAMREEAAKMGTEEEGLAAREAVRRYFEGVLRSKVQGRALTAEQVEQVVDEQLQKWLTPEGLEKQLTLLNTQIEAAKHAAGGDRPELEHKYDQLHKKALKAQLSKNLVCGLVKALHQAVQDRQDKYQNLRDAVVTTATESFHRLMVRRSHLGRLLVDDEKEELVLEVKVKGVIDREAPAIRDLKQLSGGERSYTTVAFLLALGQHTESPFRCMDEFDVFMDSINRAVATETLLEAALQDPTHQYIFLTPQDINAVNDAKQRLEKKHGTVGNTFLKVVVMRPARP